MPRYIDADLLRCVVLACSDRQGGFDADDILTMIDTVKPANVEEVKHGEWEVLWKEKKPYILQCSECGVISDKLTHFCSYCGAKMDGKENEDV